MAFEYVWIFREIELDVDTSAPATLTMKTELPDRNLTVKRTYTFNTEDTTTGRRTVRIRLAGSTKGQLFHVRIAPSGYMALFGARIFAKRLGVQDAWQWHVLPVVPTDVGWVDVPLPIPPTAQDWADVDLAVQPTSADWADVPFPIRETPADWADVELPVARTSPDWSEVPIPVPPTPADWADVPIPVPPTPADWADVRLAIPETPDLPQWVDVPTEDQG